MGKMKPEHIKLLRGVALKDEKSLDAIMSGDRQRDPSLNDRCAALVRIAALVSVDSDPSTFQWAVDLGIAAGLDDESIFDALMVIAPVIGVARLTSTLPRLMTALNIEIVEG